MGARPYPVLADRESSPVQSLPQTLFTFDGRGIARRSTEQADAAMAVRNKLSCRGTAPLDLTRNHRGQAVYLR